MLPRNYIIQRSPLRIILIFINTLYRGLFVYFCGGVEARLYKVGVFLVLGIFVAFDRFGVVDDEALAAEDFNTLTRLSRLLLLIIRIQMAWNDNQLRPLNLMGCFGLRFLSIFCIN